MPDRSEFSAANSLAGEESPLDKATIDMRGSAAMTSKEMDEWIKNQAATREIYNEIPASGGAKPDIRKPMNTFDQTTPEQVQLAKDIEEGVVIPVVDREKGMAVTEMEAILVEGDAKAAKERADKIALLKQSIATFRAFPPSDKMTQSIASAEAQIAELEK